MRTQFSILHLLGLVLVASIALALTTQLRHVGFVGSCFIVGLALGWWLREWRLSAACITGLLVFAITYLACWVHLGEATTMHRVPLRFDERNLSELGNELAKHHQRYRRYPSRLEDLQGELPLRDYWKHKYHYQVMRGNFELASLGRDGVPGGFGLDADLFFGEEPGGRKFRLPWSQFFFETPGSNGVFVSACLASILSALIWFGAERTPTAWRYFVAPVAATVFATLLIAMALAVFHVAASQSGH